jgi:hypothetical protein
MKLESLKFVIRKNETPNQFTRDVFPLEVWMPFVSCILPLAPMEVQFVENSAPLPASRSVWIEHTPLRIIVAGAPAKKTVALNVGDILVYWSTMVYRVPTPNASYLHVPACVESSRKELLLQLAHVPAVLESFPWTLTLPQKMVGISPWTQQWASQFVFQYGATEVQRAEFAHKYRHAVLVPEWNAIRLGNNPSNTLNRTTFFANPPKGVVLNAEAIAAFQRVFVFQPYWFWVVSVLCWILLVILLLTYAVQRYRESKAPPPPPVVVLPPPSLPKRRRKRRPSSQPVPPKPKPVQRARTPTRQIIVKIATKN